MDELISDRTKYIALALLGLVLIGGALLLADDPSAESIPVAAASAANSRVAAQPAPEMAVEPEVEPVPEPSASPAAAASGQASVEGGEGQDDGWGKSE